ncbi:Cdc6/Cdc18 family protein [Halorubrum lacusprofundi]|jgi:cell division control protein 6|nr:AAA family ATPase [Halorubrum lacusprofundi]
MNQDGDGGSDNGGRDIFATNSDIFENRDLLKVGYVPGLDQIVGREEQIQSVGQSIGSATVGDSPDTLLIYGKTGCGKSLVARAVTREAKQRAAENGYNFEYSYIDCSEYRTETKASRQIAREIKRSIGDPDLNIPRAGLSASDYRDMVWEMMFDYDIDSFVVILDEIDMLKDENLIRSLSRAEESGKTDGYVSLIGISNKLNYREQLDPRTDSSFRDQEIVFDPYDANRLRDILYSREEAFVDGALSESVIPKIAALAGRDHGDARKAVDTLYEAGRSAEAKNADQVNERHVDEAIEEAEIKRMQKLVSGHPTHGRYLLRSLALLTKNHEQEKNQFKTSEIYDFYKQICKKEGSDPLSLNRARRHLKEQAFLELTEIEHASEGREGAFLLHRLMAEPEIMIEGLDRANH